MPELPEVETVMRGLEPAMTGQTIVAAEIRRPDLRWPFPPQMKERLTGARVIRLGRRSKYLLIELETGETLIVHLGMSGRMVIHTDARHVDGAFHHDQHVPAKHDHVQLTLGDGTLVIFNDPRRFGAMDLIATDRLHTHKLLAKLGPEPLGNQFSAAVLTAAFKGRKTPVKSALLDQRIVAGLGNIYVCEALWQSAIAPTRQTGQIPAKRINALTSAIRETLDDAIAAGGSSLKDYRKADGELGYFQHSFRVYGREGKGCLRDGCNGTIQRLVQAGRSTFHCPLCQQ